MTAPLSEADLSARLDAVKALRGAKRTAEVDALIQLNEALLPALGAFVEDGNQATRKLVWQLLAGVRPGTDAGRAAMGAVLARMLGSSGPSTRAEALDRLVALQGNVSGVEDAVVRVLQRPSDAKPLLQALGVLERLGLSDQALERAVEPALDSWSPEVRAAAAALITSRGGSPRPSVWAGAPVSPAALQQIQKLGGVCRQPFDPAAPRPIPDSWYAQASRSSWSGQDPQGQCAAVPPAIWFITRQVRWSAGASFGFRKWGEERTLEFSGASENFDLNVDGARRLLLVQACDPSAQYHYCFDLLDPSDDPAVYSIDHDGTGPGLASRTFSEFARGLWLR